MSPSPKKIIICCDGTWQSSVSGQANIPSNVTRLARHLACSSKDAQNREWSQIVYYDSGVGTGDIGLQATVQGSSGRGLDINVIEAYNFIVLNYNPGDKIYCFGFSRGAFTARCVAGLVTDIGVISTRDMQDFPDLYQEYQKNNKGDKFRETQAYHDWVQGVLADKQDPGVDIAKLLPGGVLNAQQASSNDLRKLHWVKRPHGLPSPKSRFVDVVGVFDTVGSLGVPDVRGIDLSYFRTSYGFHNVQLSQFIRNAFHALAIDERRGPFSPTLWYIPYGQVEEQRKLWANEQDYDKLYSQAKAPTDKFNAFVAKLKYDDAKMLQPEAGNQLLYQVWFPGMHINVGGGSDDILKDKKGDLEQIANITFCWMAEMLRPHLALDTDSMTMFEMERQDALDRVIRITNYGKGVSSYMNRAKEFAGFSVDKYKIDEDTRSGWATGDLEDSFAGYMMIAGAKVRHPGQCQDERQKKSLAELGHTWEFIHPCTQYRLEKIKTYKPEAMKGLVRGYKTNDSGQQLGYEWVNKGNGLVWDEKQQKMVKGDLRIPEWIIYPSKTEFEDRSFERAAMPQEAHDWVKKYLDPVYENSKWWQQLVRKSST